MKACKMPCGIRIGMRRQGGGSASAAEFRRQMRFRISSDVFGCFETLLFLPWAVTVGDWSSPKCRMEPAFGMMIGYRMPDRLYPPLLSWRGQVMPREERALS